MHLQLRVNNLQNILIHVYFLIYLPMKYQFTKWLYTCLFFNLFTYEISIYKMVVNLQMTKEHLTH